MIIFLGLKNNKNMNTSVDRLFENENDVFLSNSYMDFQQHMPPIQELTSTPKNANSILSQPPKSNSCTLEPKDREHSAALGTEM